MNESEAQELITSFIEPWKGQQQSNIHDYILQNGVDIAHTPHKWDRGLSLPKDLLLRVMIFIGENGVGEIILGELGNIFMILHTLLSTQSNLSIGEPTRLR